MGEETAADDEVPGAVQLEEKELAGSERPEEARAARLPEVGLLQARLGGQELEPFAVRDADEGLQGVIPETEGG